MIYAVNKRTKEHKLVPDYFGQEASFYLEGGERWDIVRADADGWIEWNGGECPLPEGHLCDVRHRDGELCKAVPAGVAASPVRNDAEYWSHDTIMPSGDIIAYRPILDADTKPEPHEWNGSGLPPVGCECKYTRLSGQTWFRCIILGYHATKVWLKTDMGYYHTAPVATTTFRPIRSEEDRALDALSRAMKDAHAEGIDILEDRACCRVVYRAIRDGKVPGVKLTGGE